MSACPAPNALRDYQRDALDRLRAAVRSGDRSIVLVLPTGGGKTTIAVHIILNHIARGGQVLFLAHRSELIGQAVEDLIAAGLTHLRVIKAGGTIGPSDASVTVASIQTLATGRREMPRATLIIFDECHHTKANTWEKIAEHYAHTIRIGLTATPERSDGKPLGDIFQTIIPIASVRELTELGFLVPCAVFAPDSYRQQLAADPVDAALEHSRGRRTVVFAPGVDYARDLAQRLTLAGLPAACVDGKIPASERKRYIDQFAAGEIRCVTNCAVLTEGWNDPGVEVCILARGCDHVGLFLQIVGRILRPAPNKTHATLVDLRGAVHRHGMPDEDRSYSLDGKAISDAEKLPPLKQCRKCKAVYRPVPICPYCGAPSAMPEPPEVKRARMQQIVARETPDQRRQYWDRLRGIAKDRGYKPGWAFFRWSAKYGSVPPPTSQEAL